MSQGNGAANALASANADQQAQIQNSVNQIQNAYGSPNRQSQYTAYGNNLQNYYTGQVNNQEAINARNLKFAMARSGLTGGSAAIDSNTQLQKDYTQGLLQASQAAASGVNSLKQADIGSENQLVSAAQGGGSIGSIPGQVATAQAANLGAGQNYANAGALSNLFAGTAGIYNAEQGAAALRKSQTSPFGSFYG
jgi:hypothetical protein